MKVNLPGCAICGSTWGDVWAEVQGERMFFCCDICTVQFLGLLERIRSATGWGRVDSMEIEGDRRGRTVLAGRGPDRFRCFVAFNSEGKVRRFEPLPLPP